MLVWVNGPFGGGKTQTAHELRRRLPGSVICDPEQVGFGLQRMLPRELRSDFQDLAAWREGVVEVLDLTLTAAGRPVIAPMTLVDLDYFDEIIGRLRRRGHEVHHFALLAERETVVRRLRERGLGHLVHPTAFGLESFALAHLDRCLAQLVRPEFAEHIRTDHLDIAAVADRIAESCGLTLTPNTDGRLRGRARRAWVGLRHVRIR